MLFVAWLFSAALARFLDGCAFLYFGSSKTFPTVLRAHGRAQHLRVRRAERAVQAAQQRGVAVDLAEERLRRSREREDAITDDLVAAHTRSVASRPASTGT